MKKKVFNGAMLFIITVVIAFNINVIVGSSGSEPFITFNMSDELALGESSSGGRGPRQSTTVDCIVYTSTTTTTTNNNSNSNNGNASGSINGGWGPIGGSVSGGWNSNNSNGSSSTTTTVTNTTQRFRATKIMCQGSSGECTSFDPC